jgi:hypothetical protein
MPMPLFFAAELLYENRNLGNGVFLTQLRPMIEALGNLRNVNDHEKSYLDLLPSSCITASLGVLEHSNTGRESDKNDRTHRNKVNER